MLAIGASTANGAEPTAEQPAPPVAATVKQYAFDLVTLNLGGSSRTRRDPTSGSRMQINVASALSDEELETVKRILDRLGASPPDGAGYRHFTMSNGTRGKIGGFIDDPEVAGAGARSLPAEFVVANEFSAAEAALVLKIAVDANLFVAKPDDPTVVATPYQVTDRPFRREHPRASATLDENALAEWVRQNIPARDVADESGR